LPAREPLTLCAALGVERLEKSRVHSKRGAEPMIAFILAQNAKIEMNHRCRGLSGDFDR
jgi:hypothetical protein